MPSLSAAWHARPTCRLSWPAGHISSRGRSHAAGIAPQRPCRRPTYQTYARPLKRLGALLRDPSLTAANEKLTHGIDLKAFVAEAEASNQGMLGSATLPWPEDHEAFLGMAWLLVQSLSDEPDNAVQFSLHFYRTRSNEFIAGIHQMVSSLIIPFVRDYRDYVVSFGATTPRALIAPSNRMFIVHGREDGPREAVARFLEQQGLKPIILHEQVNRGRTVIEKVEDFSDVGFAIVLLTPDDEGRLKGDAALEPRVRQNVLLELGYFIGRLGRSRVCALKKGHVEIPSDFAGMLWTSMDDTGWKLTLAKELVAADYRIDFSRIT